MPPEPPRRGVPLGRITELNQATAPHTPVPPATDTAVTVRPPAPDPRPPPPQYAHPRPMVRAPSIVQPPALPAISSDENTLVGPEPKLDPLPEPPPSLVPPAKVAEYERELERKGQRAGTMKAVFSLLGKFLMAVTGLAAALTVTVQLVNAWLEPMVKNLEAKQRAQDVVTDPLPAKLSDQERYDRLLAAALSCRLRHIRGALERDGMSLESLPSGAMDWRSRYLPGKAVRASPEWVAADDCPEMPTPP